MLFGTLLSARVDCIGEGPGDRRLTLQLWAWVIAVDLRPVSRSQKKAPTSSGLREGIDDGFLARYRVHTIVSKVTDASRALQERPWFLRRKPPAFPLQVDQS